MQEMEIRDYINESPRCGGKYRMDKNEALNEDRRLHQLLFLSFGVLCIIQASLNLALRLTFNRMDSAPSEWNTTKICGNTQPKEVQLDFEDNRPSCFNELQEKIIALTRDRSMLEKRNDELLNIIKTVEEEKERLKMRLNGFIFHQPSEKNGALPESVSTCGFFSFILFIFCSLTQWMLMGNCWVFL